VKIHLLYNFIVKLRIAIKLYKDGKINDIVKKDIKHLYKEISYIFKDENLLIKALKHRSYLSLAKEKRYESNERLEFLGDAVLSFIVTRHLYQEFPVDSEGDLSKMKSKIVSGENLANLAAEFDLGSFLILSASEEKSGGRKKASILEDSFEALIGAIYLDGGIEQAENFIRKFVLNNIEKSLKNNGVNNYKSELLELVQSCGLKPPTYQIVKEEGPEHDKIFTVVVIINGNEIAYGSSTSKKRAEQSASMKALEIINSDKTIFGTSTTENGQE